MGNFTLVPTFQTKHQDRYHENASSYAKQIKEHFIIGFYLGSLGVLVTLRHVYLFNTLYLDHFIASYLSLF